jgi:hypothetical protein
VKLDALCHLAIGAIPIDCCLESILEIYTRAPVEALTGFVDIGMGDVYVSGWPAFRNYVGLDPNRFFHHFDQPRYRHRIIVPEIDYLIPITFKRTNHAPRDI